ncbi:MAG: hypothetical protein ABIR96_00270 [Bdellovibrionota bacterium]
MLFSHLADLHYSEIASLQNTLRHDSPLSQRARNGDLSAQRELEEARHKLDTTFAELDATNKTRYQANASIRQPDAGLAALQQAREDFGRARSTVLKLEAEIKRNSVLAKYLAGPDKLRAEAKAVENGHLLETAQTHLGTVEETFQKLAEAHPPERRLKQITGKEILPGHGPKISETPDPAYYVTPEGRFIVMGSGSQHFEYESMDDFLRGAEGQRKTFDLRYPDGTRIRTDPYHTAEAPWDLSIVRWEDGSEVMYGGAMSPKRFREGGKRIDPRNTEVAAENWSRSAFSFRKYVRAVDPVSGKESIWKSYDAFAKARATQGYEALSKTEISDVWVRNQRDLWGRKISEKPAWEGHNYGRRVRTNPDGSVWRDAAGDAWVEYEMVSAKRDGSLGDTEIYTQRMKDAYETKGERVPLLSAKYDKANAVTGQSEKVPFSITVRSFDPSITLVEGPNRSPHVITPADLNVTPELRASLGNERWSPVAFASGDYPTDKYGLHMGIESFKQGERSIGAVTPLTRQLADGTRELVDLGAEIRKAHAISWGPSRPDFFRDARGEWWVMFHGIDESVIRKGLNGRVWPSDREITEFHRNIYIAPVTWDLVDGLPRPVISD